MELEFHELDLKYERIKVRDRKHERMLLSSIDSYGQLNPVTVLSPKDNKYLVLDGFKRIRILKRLGYDTVKALVLDEDEATGLLTVYHLKGPKVRSVLEEAYLIKTLHNDHGLSQFEIGQRMGHSQSWVSRRLGLIQSLPGWLQKRVHEGELQCHAAVKYLLPMARANRNDAETFVRGIQTLCLSTREIGSLYIAWRESAPSGRELIICKPQVFLRAHSVIKKDTEEKERKSGLFQDMEMILSLSHRIHRSLDCDLVSSLNRSDIESMNQTWDAIQDRITELDMKLKSEVFQDEGRGNTSGDSQAA